MLTAVTGRIYGLNRNLEEASLGLGAASLRTMWHVMLPQIRPPLLAGGFRHLLRGRAGRPVPGAAENTLPVKQFHACDRFTVASTFRRGYPRWRWCC